MKQNDKYNFIIYTSSTSTKIQLSSYKTTRCSKYLLAINPQILPIPLRCSIKPPRATFLKFQCTLDPPNQPLTRQHLDASQRQHLRTMWKESLPLYHPYFPSFLGIMKQVHGSRVGKRKRRKEGSTEGSAEGRVQVVLVGVLVVPFEGGALQEARGRSGCKGIVTWPRGRYRFLVAARYKRET